MVTEKDNIDNLDIMQLEQLLEEYPWFSYARNMLLLNLSKVGKEYFNNKLRDTIAFVQNPEQLLSKDIINIPDTKIEDAINSQIKNIYIVGGDYFSADDLNDVKESEEKPIEKVGEFVPKGGNEPLVDYTLMDKSLSEDDFNALEFYTETLAKIFTEQEYYDQAIDVYEKLSLLYPEKNAYFADFIKEIKLKKL